MNKQCPNCGQYKVQSDRSRALLTVFVVFMLSLMFIWAAMWVIFFVPPLLDAAEWLLNHGVSFSFWGLFKWSFYFALAVGVLSLFSKGEVCVNCGWRSMGAARAKKTAKVDAVTKN